MQICNPDLPLGRHVTKGVNGGKFPKIKVTALDRIHIRKGDWNKILLQTEQRWKNKLKATSPPGLNDAITFKPFLKEFASGKMD